MVHEYLPEQRRLHQEELNELRTVCQQFPTAATMRSFQKPLSITFASLLNGSSSQLSRERHLVEDICQPDSVFGKEGNGAHCQRKECEDVLEGEPQKTQFRQISLINSEWDHRSPARLAKNLLRRKCELQFIDTEQSAQHSFLGPDPFNKEQLHGIEGFGCDSNRSLTMMLMDSSIYHVFAERLGVDILRMPTKSAVFIVDPEVSKHYNNLPFLLSIMLNSISERNHLPSESL